MMMIIIMAEHLGIGASGARAPPGRGAGRSALMGPVGVV